LVTSDETTFPNGAAFSGLGVPGYEQHYHGGFNDGFIVKFAPDGASLVYASYIAGELEDEARSVAVDSQGVAYITGLTASGVTFLDHVADSSPNFGVPTFDQTGNGSEDIFLVTLSANGQSLVDASFIGGAGLDVGSAIAIDSGGAVYITGQANSDETTFPNG